MGDQSSMGGNSYVSVCLNICQFVMVVPQCVFFALIMFSMKLKDSESRPISIRYHTWIGYGVIVLDGEISESI